jgi:6-phosphogluconate dehydrogenase
MASCNIGLIGLAVMGENLVLNMESKAFRCGFQPHHERDAETGRDSR